jgi:transitional endoplasmic reticulum ATPase
MDNLEESEGMLVVGATHNPVQVDPQIFSPGRLDRQFYLKSPDVGARRRILGRYLSDQPLALDVDINRLAALTERFTAANVHEICLEAIEQAQNKKDDRGKLTGMADLLAIINARKPTYSDEMLQAYEEFVGLHGNRLENDGA